MRAFKAGTSPGLMCLGRDDRGDTVHIGLRWFLDKHEFRPGLGASDLQWPAGGMTARSFFSQSRTFPTGASG